MGLYCQVSDIVGAASQIEITAQTKPSSGQVEAMIGDLERELNVLLVNIGYVTPVTGPEAKAQLRHIVTHGVLAHVLRARAFGASNGADFLTAADQCEKEYQGYVKRLGNMNDPYTLAPDATRNEADVQKLVTEQVSSHVQGLPEVDFDTPVVSRTEIF